MPALFNSLPMIDLPLVKGDDLNVRFTHKPLVVDSDGNPVLLNGQKQFVTAPFPDGTSLHIEIDGKNARVILPGVISGAYATVWGSHELIDDLPAKLDWRVKIIYANGLNKVAGRGKTVR